jgi:cell division protein ZipA
MPELRWILIVAGLLVLIGVYWWGRRIKPSAEEKETILRSRAEPLISSEPLAPDPYINEAFSIDPEPTDHAPYLTAAVNEPSNAAMDDAPALEPSRREPVFEDDRDIVIDSDDEPTVTPEEAAAEAGTEQKDEQRTVVEPPPQTSPAPSSAPRRARAPMPRKIVVLRLAAGPSRIPGDKLRAAFAAQGLVFGKYEIFHYIQPGGETLFSVASMVEPGSFDPAHMDTTTYPGVTLFAQLPSSLPGQEVLDELLRNAKLLQAAIGGTLQDERGGLLNSPRIQRLRQEVAEFEQLCQAQQSEPVETPAVR